MAERKRTTRRNRGDDSGDEDLRMFEAFKTSPALATEDDLREIETQLRTGSDGCNRRLALALLTLSGKDLIGRAEESTETAEALSSAAAVAEHVAVRLRELADLCDTAALWVRFAMCVRDDGLEMLESGRARVLANVAAAEIPDAKLPKRKRQAIGRGAQHG